MKKIFLLIALTLLTISTAAALDPIKVAIVNTSTTPISVEVRLNNYTGGTASLIYTQPATNYTPNGSGIIIANIAGAGWTAIASNSVTSYHILDVYVGGTLAAQYRLDNLLLSQSQGGVLDIEGNLTPPESGAGSVGTDGNRWSDVYVEESTMHIGPADGEFNNTELALSYNTTTNTAHIQVDATDAILATSSGVTIPGTLSQTAGQVIFGGNVDANGGLDIAGAGTLTRTGGTGFLATVDGGSGLVLGSYPALRGNANANTGVSGTSNSGIGIFGASNSNHGVNGLSFGSGVSGVYGRNDAAGGFGLLGSSLASATAIQGNSNTGIAGHFINTNAANTSTTLLIDNNGTNDALEINATGTGLAVDINGSIDISGDVTLSNLASGGTQNLQVDNTGKIVVGGGGTVSTNSTINGDGTTGSPLGLNLANANTWTGVQTFNGTSTLIGGNLVLTSTNKISNSLLTAVTIDDDLNIEGNLVFDSGLDAVIANLGANIKIQDDLNITGSLDVDTGLNVDGNTTHDGTLDQQGAISNSTGDLLINDTFIANSTGNRIGNNTSSLQLDIDGVIGTPALNVDGDLYITGASTLTGAVTLSNLTGAGTRNIAVNASGEVVVAESSVNTDATINGNGTTASPLGINLANSNTWSGQQTFGNVTTTGTLDQQGAISNSTGDLLINDTFIANSTGNRIGNNTASLQLDIDGVVGTPALNVDGDLYITGASTFIGAATLDNLTGAGTRNIAVNASGEVVVAESSVNTDATINGNGTTASPLGINLANSNTWTGAQTLPTTSAQGNALISSINAGNTTIDAARVAGGGGGALNYTEVTADITLNTDSQVVFITLPGGPFEIKLPASPSTGQLVHFYTEDLTAIIDPNTKAVRDGGTDYTAAAAFSSYSGGVNVSLFYNGSKWLIISK